MRDMLKNAGSGAKSALAVLLVLAMAGTAWASGHDQNEQNRQGRFRAETGILEHIPHFFSLRYSPLCSFFITTDIFNSRGEALKGLYSERGRLVTAGNGLVTKKEAYPKPLSIEYT